MGVVREPLTDARPRLAGLCAAAQEPVLDSVLLESLLADAALPDAAGIVPAAAGWEPTWELDAAAAAAWRWKAGQVAGDYRSETDGQRFHREQRHTQYLRMASEYSARVSRAVRLA